MDEMPVHDYLKQCLKLENINAKSLQPQVSTDDEHVQVAIKKFRQRVSSTKTKTKTKEQDSHEDNFGEHFDVD